MLVGSSLCAFSCSTHTHIKMLTRIINLQVCVCASVSMCDGTSEAGGREGKGRKKGGDDRRFLSIRAFILPEPLKTVVLGWEKIHRGGVLKACGAR